MIPRKPSVARLTWVLAGVGLVLALTGAGNDYVSAARARQNTSPGKPGQTAGQSRGTVTPKPSAPQHPGDPRQGQRPPRKPWWQDEVIKKEIALTDDQAKRIQALWDTVKPEIDQYFQERDKQQKELERLMSVRADDWTVMMQIDKVEALRTVLNKRRTMVFYRMHKVLTPQQDAKLKAITNSDDGRRGGSPR